MARKPAKVGVVVADGSFYEFERVIDSSMTIAEAMEGMSPELRAMIEDAGKPIPIMIPDPVIHESFAPTSTYCPHCGNKLKD